MTRRKKRGDPEELLEEARAFRPDFVGRTRAPDGTLCDWRDWAADHPQGDEAVTVCRGRDAWEECCREETTTTGAACLSVVSWNVLSRTWHSEGGYDHVPPGIGDWTTSRLPSTLEWIGRLRPDVLALQEVDFDVYERDLSPALRRIGYDGVVQRPKKRSAKQPCGVATFWRRGRFEALEEKHLSRTLYTLLGERPSSVEGAAERPSPRLCVGVVNMHLESSQTADGFDKRARQLHSALEHAATVRAHAAHHYYEPSLVLCGDANTGADAPPFRVLRECAWHGHSLASAYEHPATDSTTPVNRGTFAVPGHQYAIDQLLYSHETLRLRAALDALTEDESAASLGPLGCCDRGFPNRICPSDHIPVGAVLEFVPPPTPRSPSHAEEAAPPQKPSERRREEIADELAALKRKHPPPSSMRARGRPTPEQIAERKEYSNRLAEWGKSFEDEEEVRFVKKLIKKEKR